MGGRRRRAQAEITSFESEGQCPFPILLPLYIYMFAFNNGVFFHSFSALRLNFLFCLFVWTQRLVVLNGRL
jgi:hypothetical protein